MGWLKSIIRNTSVLLSGNQPEPVISPLREPFTAGTSNNHAAARQQTIASCQQDIKKGMVSSAMVRSPERDSDGTKHQYRSSSTRETSAEDHHVPKAMADESILQASTTRKQRQDYDYASRLRAAPGTAEEGENLVYDASVYQSQRQDTQQTDLWTKYIDVKGIRAMLKQQRTRFKTRRQELYQIDDKFVQKLERIALVDIGDMKDFVAEIVKHYRILQETRSAVALAEFECEALENQLAQGEHELASIEFNRFQTSTANAAEVEEDGGNINLSEEDPTESVVSSQNIRRNQSDEARRYLSQKGDVDILKEQLMDFQVYHSQVLAEQADREDAGLEPDSALTIFLDEFDQQYEALTLRVKAAEAKLAEYEDALQEPEDQYTSAASLHGNDAASERSSVEGSNSGKNEYATLELSKIADPEIADRAQALYLKPSKPLSIYKLLDTESGNREADKAIYINSWILFHLRRSPAEIARLVSEHEQHGLRLELGDFKREVLEYWFRDETIHAFDFTKLAANYHDVSMYAMSGNTPKSRPASQNAVQAEQNSTISLERRLSARHTQTER